MQKLQMENVDIFYDILDEACMTLYEELHISYLQALIRVGNDIVFQIDDSKISPDCYKKLREIYLGLDNKKFFSEEIRLAFELLVVKAFKHENMPLDVFTPDTICYLFGVIINDKFMGKSITIMDTLLGTSNLLQAISNNLEDSPKLIGIENNLNLVKLSEISSNLQNNVIKIYFQDALNDVLDKVDVVIGDMESKDYDKEIDLSISKRGVKYFPYLVMMKRLANLKDGGYFIYVIDNDFFEHDGNMIFHEELSKEATLMALITLPKSVVNDNHPGKSILIGKKEVLSNYQIAILSIDNFDRDYLEDVFVRLEKLVKEI